VKIINTVYNINTVYTKLPPSATSIVSLPTPKTMTANAHAIPATSLISGWQWTISASTYTEGPSHMAGSMELFMGPRLQSRCKENIDQN
jgi:hypothetical protein